MIYAITSIQSLKVLIASAFLALPALTAAVGTCMVRGQPIDCSVFFATYGWIFATLAVFWLALAILVVSSAWIVYKKAGQPGWASIIPIYNLIVMLQIVGKPIWWIFLMFIPLVNIIIGIIVVHRLALSFGKDVGFTIGLLLLSPIFYPILAFGRSTYQRLPDSQPAGAPPTV